MRIRIRIRRPLIAVAIATLLCLLAACTGETGPSAAPSDEPAVTATSSPSASTSTPAPVPGCELLTSAEVTTLAGLPLAVTKQYTQDDIPLSGCDWGESTAPWVNVESTESTLWTIKVPQIVTEISGYSDLLDADTPLTQRILAAVERIKKAELKDEDEACDVFSDLAELLGQPAGTTSFVTTSADSTPEVSGQTCTDGRWTRVRFRPTSADGATAATPRMPPALDAAHQRALAPS